jgi:hypothetical protein
MKMKTTLGQLVADLFEEYQHRYHDEELAAVATQVTLRELMRSSRAPRLPGGPR